MKTKALAILFILTAPLILFGQNAGSMIVPVPNASPRVLRYILYRHFLGWVNSLYATANADGQPADPYQFAKPFARAGLSHPNIDALVKEARAMANDLKCPRRKDCR
ncbi:MAG TPA: hypothetical protein VHZ07_17485 [Bryobacteraceae bacterium]|jgi:hypothetical protein|nr:hypothetical protein [Bryobacteraceae bacterium]